jgi:hypothetical protein
LLLAVQWHCLLTLSFLFFLEHSNMNINPRHKPETKAEKNLARRRADYSRMINQPSFKAPDGAYHRPGSNKK